MGYTIDLNNVTSPAGTAGMGNKSIPVVLVDGNNIINHNLNGYIVNLTMLSNDAGLDKEDISLNWKWIVTGGVVNLNSIKITASLDAPINVLLNLQSVSTI